jgi:hypothetical protein
MNETTSGFSPAPKEPKHPRLGELSPTQVDIDVGDVDSAIDETHGLAPGIVGPGEIIDPSLPPPPPPPSDDTLPPWFGKMKISFLEGVDEMFDRKMVPIQNDIKEIKGQVQDVKLQAEKAEALALEAKSSVENLRDQFVQAPPSSSVDEDLRKRVQEIETKFCQGSMAEPGGLATNTLVAGGFKVSLAAATQWVNKLVREAQNIAPLEVYEKGRPDEEFKGLLFMKFRNIPEATSALATLKDSLARENIGKDVRDKIWCDFEFPLEKRVCDSFLNDLRKQLREWEYPKECIEVNKDLGHIKVGGTIVAKVEVKNSEFGVKWDSQWETWEKLQSSTELQAMMAKAKDKVDKNKSRIGKGASKGLLQ